jgi:hypothetical protein
MNFIAYDPTTMQILAVAPSLASALERARSKADLGACVNAILASDALAAAAEAGAVRHWGFNDRSVACLSSELTSDSVGG